MTAFVIATVLGVVVTAVYLALAGRSFAALRAQLAAGEPVIETAADFDTRVAGFRWKAPLAVLASTLVLVLISTTPVALALTPFLSIGTAIAVITAFLVERR